MRTSFTLLSLLLAALTYAGYLSTAARFGGSHGYPMAATAEPALWPTPLTEPPPRDGTQKSGPAVGDRQDLTTTAAQSQTEPTSMTLPELVEQAQLMLSHMRTNVRDYTATMVKRERIGGELKPETRMEIKVRNPPANSPPTSASGLSAYLKFTEPAAARGREVIWVDRGPNSKLIAHESGFLNLLRVELDPQGTLAMVGNKYPITEIGLLRLLEKLLEKIRGGIDLSQARIEVRNDVSVGDRSCQLIQLTQPQSTAGAEFYIAQVFIDRERQVPLRYAAYLRPPQPGGQPVLDEEYTYLDLDLNVGLTSADFDPDYPAYNFP